MCLHAEQTYHVERERVFGDSARIASSGFVDDLHTRFAYDPLGRVWPRVEAEAMTTEMSVLYPPPLALEWESRSTEFEYLETVTRYATPCIAFCTHKELPASSGRGMYRVARFTSATDSRVAVQRLANTFMRMFANCTFPVHAVECMRRFGRLVQEKANYSAAKVEGAWRCMSKHPRYALDCRDLEHVWSSQ